MKSNTLEVYKYFWKLEDSVKDLHRFFCLLEINMIKNILFKIDLRIALIMELRTMSIKASFSRSAAQYDDATIVYSILIFSPFTLMFVEIQP